VARAAVRNHLSVARAAVRNHLSVARAAVRRPGVGILSPGVGMLSPGSEWALVLAGKSLGTAMPGRPRPVADKLRSARWVVASAIPEELVPPADRPVLAELPWSGTRKMPPVDRREEEPQAQPPSQVATRVEEQNVGEPGYWSPVIGKWVSAVDRGSRSVVLPRPSNSPVRALDHQLGDAVPIVERPPPG
jgi:hypothetical protein